MADQPRLRGQRAPAPQSIPGVQNSWSGPSLHPHLLRSGAASYLAVARIDTTCPPQDLSALALAAQIDPPLTAVLLNNGGAPPNLITHGPSPLLLLFYTWHTTLCLISLRCPRVRRRHLPHTADRPCCSFIRGTPRCPRVRRRHLPHAADRHVHRDVQSLLRHATLTHTRRRAARSFFR